MEHIRTFECFTRIEDSEKTSLGHEGKRLFRNFVLRPLETLNKSIKIYLLACVESEFLSIASLTMKQ